MVWGLSNELRSWSKYKQMFNLVFPLRLTSPVLLLDSQALLLRVRVSSLFRLKTSATGSDTCCSSIPSWNVRGCSI